MKKKLLLLLMAIFSIAYTKAQCVFTCSNYAVSAITFTTFPSAGTNAVPQFSPNTDDGITPLINIGFNFNFYCTTYTQVWICSNGFIQFNNGVPAVSSGFSDATQAFPSNVAPDDMVALNMCDLDAGYGSVTYTTLGTAPNRMFVVTYSNVPVFGYAASLNTGQIVLYETSNNIEIYTGSVINNSGTTGTQGIENANGTLGATSPGKNNVIWSDASVAYRFSPYSTSPPNPIMGTATLCAGSSATYSVAPSAGALSYAWSIPPGWMGTSTTTAISATAGLSGSFQVVANYTCGTSSPVTFSVHAIPAPPIAIALSPQVICSGASITLTPSGAASYTLEPGTIPITGPYTVTPDITTTYTLYGIDNNGCTAVNNPMTLITVNQTPTVTVNSGSVCSGQSFTITANGADTYSYSTAFTTINQPVPGIYTYSVTGTNTNNCTGVTAVSTLSVIGNPTLSISATRTIICKGNSATITAQGADAFSWTNGPAAAAYSIAPLITTIYTVTGTNTNGCLKTASISIVVDNCTGIAELSGAAANFISAYPNPSQDAFTISTIKQTLVEIYDMSGRLVLKQTLEEGSHSIHINEANAGQYLLRAVSGDATRSIVLIKE